jgi:AcrR family transcriptional regulator
MTVSDLPPVPRLPSRSAGPQRRQPRARALTRESIIAAALRIIDAEGLDAMTMRTVAQSLGTGAASLYAYVSGKEELLELVIERVIGEVEWPEKSDPARWQEQLKECARSIRAVFARHRDLARASFARIPVGENALRGSEWMITVMRGAGLADPVIAFACDLLPLYVMAIAYEESLYSSETNSPEDVDKFISDLREYFLALPADRFPGIVSMAALLTSGGENDRFEFGLDVLLRGLAAMPR